jgi:hypothetical protein
MTINTIEERKNQKHMPQQRQSTLLKKAKSISIVESNLSIEKKERMTRQKPREDKWQIVCWRRRQSDNIRSAVF